MKQIVRTPLTLEIPDVSLLALDKLELGAGRRGRGYYLRLISIIQCNDEHGKNKCEIIPSRNRCERVRNKMNAVRFMHHAAVKE